MTALLVSALGMPGGAELAIALLIAFLFVVVSFVLVVVGVWYFVTQRSAGNADQVRVEKLESQVSELESQVAELQRRLDDADQG